MLGLGQILHHRGDHLTRECDLGVAFFTLLGGDHHNTVGSTRTVKRRCGRAFQDRHALDVLGVDIHHTVGRGGGTVHHTVKCRVTNDTCRVVVDDTIHNEQRLRVAVLSNRGTTTQDDLGTGTGSTRRLGDVHTSNLTREGVDGVSALVAHQFLGLQVVNGITQ